MNNIFLLFILLYNIECLNYSYITYDLHKYINKSLNYDEPLNLIYYNSYSLYYTFLTFGSKEKKYIMQINLDDYDFELTNYKCNIETNITAYDEEFFNPFLSETSIIEISGINFSYYGPNIIYRITDNIKVKQNNSLNYIYPKIIFIYNPRNYSSSKYRSDFSPYTCFKFGLRLPYENYYSFEDYRINLIGQFKRKKVTNSFEWFIEYNNDINPKLIIGISPYEYDNNKYNDSRNITSIYISGSFYYWNLEFSQIYFIIDGKRDLLDYRKAALEPSFNYIKGPFEYFKFINETFFENFFINKKCFIDIAKGNYYFIYYCLNEESIKNELKQKFLNINLVHSKLDKEFVLNYEDLFIEKNNKIYFLVIYDNNIRFNWILGKPFLKKYFFSYNYEKKLISFYETEKENYNDKNSSNDLIYIIIIIILVIIFSILGFFLAKFVYNYNNKKKGIELFDVDDNNYVSNNKESISPILDNNEN